MSRKETISRAARYLLEATKQDTIFFISLVCSVGNILHTNADNATQAGNKPAKSIA